MKREAAKSIVDAYGWSVELASENIQDAAKVKADGLCDAPRDYLISLLSDNESEER